MIDADEFVPVAERYEGLPVLKSDRARGAEARYAEAHEFVEENAAVRVASALWHELKATLRPLPVRYRDTTYECQSIEAPQGWADCKRSSRATQSRESTRSGRLEST